MLLGAHDDTRGTPSEPPPSRKTRSSCASLRPKAKPRHDRRPRVPAHRLRVRTSPTPYRSNCPRWRASEFCSAKAGCTRAFPSRGVLRSVTHCGPTLSHTPTRATRTAFLSAFPKPVLRCVGGPHGGTYPHNFCVDLTCARAYATLGELHLDHEQDLVVTSDMWVRALAARAPARARNVERRRQRRATLPPALLGAAGAGVPSPGKCTGVSD